MELRQEGVIANAQQSRLVLSPQIQLAIEVMQLPVMELAALIIDEVERNPLLNLEEEEEGEEIDLPPEDLTDQLSINFDDNRFEALQHLDADYQWHFSQDLLDVPQLILEEKIASIPSLFEDLTRQLPEAALLVGYLDASGRLSTPIEEIAKIEGQDPKELEEHLWALQEIAPPGIAARNLRESYLLQLNARQELSTLTYLIVSFHWAELLNNRLPQIAQALATPMPYIRMAINHLSHLQLSPASHYDHEQAQVITPDLIFREAEGELWPEVNTEPLPQLRLNENYLHLLEEGLPGPVHTYLHKQLTSGKWLRKCLIGRHETLRRIGEYLIYAQGSFLSDVKGQLHPMTMLEVSEALGLHESTIARAVSGKYFTCPRGTFSLRELFTHAYTKESGERISARQVKERLLELIDQEDKQRPLSDAKLAEQLQLEGLPCARRTIAKYRHQCSIPPKNGRRQF
ncbi:MAG: RNA polymerase factor sigma-54 [Verrucomicrobia bacterium]|nr:RNA polymerase factor sigma-54 [Verrucomicrobiota bacterium]